MADELSTSIGTVEPFRGPTPSTAVSDELNRILTLLRDACPENSHVSFDFDGRLHVHIDVRKREDVTIVEMILSKLGAGLFYGISRSGTPHHPFFHRVSAIVAR